MAPPRSRVVKGRFAEVLTFLFDHIRDENGEEHSQPAVASYVKAQGISCTDDYISKVRRGKSTNPSLEMAAAIAEFFDQRIEIFDKDSVTFRLMQQDVAEHGSLDMERVRRNAAAALLSPGEGVLLRKVSPLSERDHALVIALIDQLVVQSEHAADDDDHPGPPQFVAPKAPPSPR